MEERKRRKKEKGGRLRMFKRRERKERERGEWSCNIVERRKEKVKEADCKWDKSLRTAYKRGSWMWWGREKGEEKMGERDEGIYRKRRR